MDKDIKRKSTRNFNLEKNPKHKFELEKEAPAAGPDTNSRQPEINTAQPASAPENNGGSKKTVWIIVGIIIVAVLAFFGIKSCNKSQPPVANPTDTTNVNKTDSAQTDSTKIDTTANAGSSDNGASGPSSNTQETPGGETSAPTQNGGQLVSTATQDGIKNAADRVLDGEFGNGAERKQKLGSDYAAVQRYVNKLYKMGLAPRK